MSDNIVSVKNMCARIKNDWKEEEMATDFGCCNRLAESHGRDCL